MKIPKAATIADNIARLLHETGTQSTDQIVAGLASHSYLYHSIHNALSVMQDYGQITLSEAGFTLARELHKYYSYGDPDAVSTGEVATHRYSAPFRPIQAKYIPSAQARRHDAPPARDIHFKTATDAPSVYWNGAMV